MTTTATKICGAMVLLPEAHWSLRDLIAATQQPRETYKPALDFLAQGRLPLIAKNTNEDGETYYTWKGNSVAASTL